MRRLSLHHVALRTGDVVGLAAFYRDVVGLSSLERPGGAGGGTWLAAGDAILMLEPRADGEPDIPIGSKDLLAFAIDPGERPAFEERLVRLGVRVEASTPYTLYFRDPDGRRVGVSHYPILRP